LASNQRLGELVERVFGSRQFEDLRIPLAVVATDLSSGEPVVFTQGNLVDAIRASCAFPGLFEPVEIGTRCLADGGLVAPVPTEAARSMGAQTVIGVSVGLQDGNRGVPTNIRAGANRSRTQHGGANRDWSFRWPAGRQPRRTYKHFSGGEPGSWRSPEAST